LLGRNGTGKTSLMKLIHGEVPADSGKVIRQKGIQTALLTQDLPVELHGTIYTIIAQGVASPHSLEHQMDGSMERKVRQQIERAIAMLDLEPDFLFENLSVGMKRRVLLGRAIAVEPELLLLDEPTNHLDVEAIIWLENFLLRYDKTVFFVTHDRAFLQRVAGRILELDRGKIFDWQCDYKTFIERKEAWLESEETRHQLFDKKLAQEEAWIRKGVKARRTRNEGRVRALKKMRQERAGRREVQGGVRMQAKDAGKSGAMVVEASDISFGYDGNNLIEHFSVRILRGDKIFVKGAGARFRDSEDRLQAGRGLF
jgi:ATP-binding cassette subfamily F protein uup